MPEVEKSRKPRDFLYKPRQFGRVADAPWKDAAEADRYRLAAAYFQHRVACQVVRAIDLDPDLTLDAFAKRIGMKTDTLRRKLYGSSTMTLEDVVALADAAGVDVLPVIQSRDDLFPPRTGTRGTF